MDQYVKVTFHCRCAVLVDGVEAGFTNKIFQVETGKHVFDLGTNPCNPTNHTIDVCNTLPDKPLVIIFEKV